MHGGFIHLLEVLLLLTGGLFAFSLYCRNWILGKIQKITSDFSAYLSEQFRGFCFFLSNEAIFHKTTLFLIITSGVLIRLYFLIYQPIYHDEAKTVFSFASVSIFETISNYYVPNNHIFHSLLVKIFIIFFGNHPWSIRMPVFIAGILTLLMCYAVCRRFFDKQTALIATALCAGNYPLIQYSSNARGYMLVTFFFLAMLYFAMEIRKTRRKTPFVLFVFLGAFGMWTIPTMVYPIAISLFSLFFLNISLRKILSAAVLILILTALLYTPALIRSGLSSIVANQYVRTENFKNLIIHAGISLRETHAWFHYMEPYILNFTLTALFIFALLAGFNHRKISMRFFLMVILPCLSLILIKKSIGPIRIWLFLLPPYFFITANGLTLILNPLKKNVFVYPFSALFLLIFLLPETIHGISNPFEMGDSCVAAKEIVDFLTPSLTDNTVLESETPCTGPIRYYLISKGISLEHFLWFDPKKSNPATSNNISTVYLVTKRPENELALYGYSKKNSGFSQALLSKTFGDMNIYHIDKIRKGVESVSR